MSRGVVLIVDDNVELAENLAEILADLGHDVLVADTAERALEIAGERPIGGLIVDYRLPGKTGVELIVELRARGVDAPAVMITGCTADDVVADAEEAGAMMVFAKPVDPARLLPLVEEFDRSRKDVLVVDDNQDLADDLVEAFASIGLAARSVSTARAALAQRSLPRAALLDLHLPDGSGLDVARRLCARDPRIRLILMTGFPEDVGDHGRSLEGTQPPVVAKPFSMSEVIERVARAVGR